MAQDRVVTGALALLKIDGQLVGKATRVTATERYNRSPVRVLGQPNPTELPMTSWEGTLQFGFFNVDLRRNPSYAALNREVSTNEQFFDNLLLDDTGIQVDIFKKIKDPNDSNNDGIILRDLKKIATIKGLFINSEDFDIQEGQISGRNQSFDYLYPMIFPTSDNS